MPAIYEHTQNVVQHHVEVSNDIFGEEAKDEIAVFLQELVFTAVAAIGNRIAEVLRSIDLDRNPRLIADQINSCERKGQCGGHRRATPFCN